MSFDKAFNWILTAEGGLVNDPNDKGGLTNMGISQRSYPSVDVKNLTQAVAKSIYLRDFWSKGVANKLPDPLDVCFFDASVNQGPTGAVKILQTALGVNPDGIVGNATLAAIDKMDIDDLVVNFMAARAIYYSHLSDFTVFGKGWNRRLFKLMKFISK